AGGKELTSGRTSSLQHRRERSRRHRRGSTPWGGGLRDCFPEGARRRPSLTPTFGEGLHAHTAVRAGPPELPGADSVFRRRTHEKRPCPYACRDEAARRDTAVMPQEAATDPYADPLRFGQRVQILRERRGMTQAQLADFVGVSPHTLRKIENGQQKTPGLDMVMRIAEALRVRDLGDLTGRPDTRVDLFIGPGHPRLAAVKAAVDSFPPMNSVEPPPVAHLEARLHAAWRKRHASKNHREAIGRLLPDLIRDAQALTRHADTATERRRAQALLAGVY